MRSSHGARGHRFDAARAARLDEPERLAYLPPERIAALLDAPAAAIVLDFGAGTGTYALALAKLRPDVRVVALDIQPEMLALLQQKDGAEAIVCGGPELLESYAGRVDRVMAINVLHEVDDAGLRALFAAAGPQTRLVFIDWNADVERPAGPAKEHVYSPAEATERLAPFGFAVERVELFPFHYGLFGRAKS
jgi:SAM-dependent methyltransferase